MRCGDRLRSLSFDGMGLNPGLSRILAHRSNALILIYLTNLAGITKT